MIHTTTDKNWIYLFTAGSVIFYNNRKIRSRFPFFSYIKQYFKCFLNFFRRFSSIEVGGNFCFYSLKNIFCTFILLGPLTAIQIYECELLEFIVCIFHINLVTVAESYLGYDNTHWVLQWYIQWMQNKITYLFR